MYILARVWPTLRSRKGRLVVWKRGHRAFGSQECIYLLESYSLAYLLKMASEMA